MNTTEGSKIMTIMDCDCMTEDLNDGLGERVLIHSLDCIEHPEYNND